jgi:hypothetical protein
MAKSKQQKREEALKRAHEKLMGYDIPKWCDWFGSNGSWRDEESDALFENSLVRAAYVAHCDRHGNYLDHRFYRELPIYTKNPEPFECAMAGKLYSLEEMRTVIHSHYGQDAGKTLYQIAYHP